MALPQLESLNQSRTLTQQVTTLIRDSILQGKLAGGQVLRQEDLAEQLKVSRIPVREALRQLDAEGYVALNPHRGAVVVALSPADVAEIYDIRVALETQALCQALPHFTAEIFQRAQAILDSIDQERDLAKWGALNWQFHEALYQPAKRLRLLGMIKMLHDNVGRYLRIYVTLNKHAHLSQQQHRELLAACKKGNAERAALILEQHLHAASRGLCMQLQQQPKA